MNNSVEIITVNYCTPELIKKLVRSVRKYEGDYPIRVIDGSDKEPYISQMRDIMDIDLEQFGYNIHHGRGLDYGIKTSKYEWCLLVDSDVTIKKPVINKLFITKMFSNKMIIGRKLNHYTRNGTKYDYYSLSFLLINQKFYMRMRNHGIKFIHDGAPGYMFFRHIHDKKMNVCINVFDNRGIKWDEYIEHRHRGTRDKFNDRLKAIINVK